MFNSQQLTVMKADTFNQVLDSVLSQRDKSRNLHLIAFFSQKFTESELNYEIHDKKLLAIVEAFKQ